MRVYIVVDRVVANLGEQNWVDLMTLIWQIAGQGNRPHQILHRSAGPVTFVLNDVEYSNTYLLAAEFNFADITFERFRQRLVTAFGVQDELVTFATGTLTIKDEITTFATYAYNAVNRFRIGVLGCEVEGECSYAVSQAEMLEFRRVEGWDI